MIQKQIDEGASIRRLWIPMAVYAVLAILLLPFYRYAIDVDGTGYISAARKYASGDFWAAVNGHWSPLLSWLLIPWLKISVPEVLAVKITLALAGLLALAWFIRLANHFALTRPARIMAVFAFMPMGLYYAFDYCTADFLMLSLMLAYLSVLFDPEYPAGRWSGAWCGILGGLAYLAKAYALPFFCLHFSLVSLLHAWRAESAAKRKAIGTQALLGFLCFGLISVPWIGALSHKYGGFTISTGSSYNWSFNNPQAEAQLSIDMGLVPPASAKDISAWDEPPAAPDLQRWSPLDSWNTLKHWLVTLARRTGSTLVIMETGSLLSLPILILSLIACLRDWRNVRRMPRWYLPLLTIMIFPAGYILLWVCERYLWLIVVLPLLLGAQVLSGFLPKCKTRAIGFIMLAVLALSFMVYPVQRLYLCFNNRKNLHHLAGDLKREHHIAGRLASHNRYRESLYLSYFMGAQYYGHTRGLTGADMQKRLTGMGVNYYLVWNEDDRQPGAMQPLPAFLNECEEVPTRPSDGLRIFKLR